MIRITHDSDTNRTAVYVNGEKIKGVTAVSFRRQRPRDIATIRLTIKRADIEIVADDRTKLKVTGPTRHASPDQLYPDQTGQRDRGESHPAGWHPAGDRQRD